MIKIYKYGQISNEEIFARNNPLSNVGDVVKDIIENVKTNGDKALFDYCLKFDKAELDSLEVSENEFLEAFNEVDEEFVRILNEAKENIIKFHSRQVRNSFIINDEDGVVLGQKVMPLKRVGLYVPGGTAAYPSTVLMDALPAKIAGVNELVITTPPNKQGKINPVILVAARIAGVDKVYKVGGAQAVAALAYGTDTIKRVDKIVGPGNAFVAEAKKQVYGQVSIDMIAGPSEILIVADKHSNPKHLAADMLSQAEHDVNASAVLVVDDEVLANKVSEELERQIALLERSSISRKSIDDNGKIIVANNIDEAIAIANEIAPEHLELCLDQPFDYLSKIENAGSIFMGRNCPEALGDYLAGPNHTLPTSGTARFFSPLSVDDFVKKSQYTYYSKDAIKKVAKDIAYFANKEGLQAHGLSALARLEDE